VGSHVIATAIGKIVCRHLCRKLLPFRGLAALEESVDFADHAARVAGHE
jgi:hypothetical protein